jgi:hypothetical protein
MNKESFRPHPEIADGGPTIQRSEPQVDFGNAQGSSCHDEADLRDVARKAAKKSQRRNSSSEE